MANAITLTRLPFLVVIVALLYWGTPAVQVVTAFLVLILIFMDTLDGVVARRRSEVGMLGSKLDIAVDRIVEQVLWIVYAHLGLIPVAIPIIFVIRGGLVDTVRSFSLIWGETSFGMMHTKWGRRLVASGWMRSTYGIAKAVAFWLLALALGLRGLWAATPRAGWAEAIGIVGIVVSWIATLICCVRGAPVLIEAPRRLRGLDDKMAEHTTGQATRP
ncbi:MAG: CDP-alcohol phosphatidyltransferase family protein [Anaerolineae bacterium]|nr:CDP-alcohol phosphatidyltransferase family protein [Anaerolineae bacterium]